MRRLYRAGAALARWGAALSLLLVMAAGALTVADIVLRSATGRGILGTTDITQLLIMGAAFAAIPYGFFVESHVSVDLATDRLPPRALAAVKAVSAGLALLLLIGVVVYGTAQARIEAGYGDASSTIGIPKTWYWIALIAGCALSVCASAVVMLRHGLTMLGGRDVGASD
jgi:TRAP-type C4-dicarboxylate transport system permease small subunit